MLKLVAVLLCLVFVATTAAHSVKKKPAPHPMSWGRMWNTEKNILRGKASPASNDVEAQWFDQKVDHFDPLNTATWKQLFYVNDQWFDPVTGPVFFYFNGEGPLSPSAVTSDYFVTELAQRYGALMVSHEHRYYGQSFPVPDLSTENLKYLTVEQALEDAAYFQQWMTESYGLQNNSWVIMGGSYSGFLSTAYRIKYPHLVVAAYSSSGVVEPIEDYPQYWEVCDQDYAWLPSCYAGLQNVSDSVNKLWSAGASGWKQLQSMFNLCEELTSADEADFFNTVSAPEAVSAQYGYTEFVCPFLEEAPTPLEGWSYLFKTFGETLANINWANSCVDIHWQQDYSNTTLYVPYTGARTWIWQTCIEFGWFQTLTTIDMWSPLVNLDYFLAGCETMFGISGMAPDTQHIITEYGGVKPESSQIVSCAGLADPWHPACQLSTYKDSEPVIFIEAQDASHCKDMSAPSPNDSAELTAARQEVQDYLDQWLWGK